MASFYNVKPVLALLIASLALTQGSRLRANALAEAYAKAGAKLPWPMLDADGGEEYEVGNEEDTESDPKTFSLSQYEHTDARDDADLAEDDELNHGESDPEDSQDGADEDE